MRTTSDNLIEPTIALLAPVPLDLLEDASVWKPGGEIAFGRKRAWRGGQKPRFDHAARP
jgi:hypothetical protein